MRIVHLSALVTLLAGAPLGFAAEFEPAPGVVAVFFVSDPLADPDVVLNGSVLDRLTWNQDEPAFPGDRPGSLTARYDSDPPAGTVGWPLPTAWTQDDAFTATAVLVIEPEGFQADPFGFFQISWGLWNSRTTGLERTGNFESFAGDAFELIEFDYYPNISPFFGGPFLSPSVFGVADVDNPLFDFLGSFVNLSFGSVEVELPLGVPLVTVLEHRPGDAAVVVSVHRSSGSGSLLPVPGAVALVPLQLLSVRDYSVDTLGLTLWRDGFAGENPSLRAFVTFHALTAHPGVATREGF